MKHRQNVTSVLPWMLACALAAGAPAAYGADGFLSRNGETLFPIGCYELPESDEALAAMAKAGINMVHCHSRADLDRAYAAGLMAVVPLPLQEGPTDALKAKVAELVDHPAIAIWEGPDEIVWNFTAFSGLHRTMGIHKTPGEWWRQTSEAVAYAEQQAAQIIPNMRAAVEYIHSVDTARRPVWINEAQSSDVHYVRQCMDFVDITGCDIYPVNPKGRPLFNVGNATERWLLTGEGKPVWMVLQAFSWHELGDYYGHKEAAYPSYADTRFMAYDVITRGAHGVLYWGSRFTKNDAFRASILAIAHELAMLHPFLTAPGLDGVKTQMIDLPRRISSSEEEPAMTVDEVNRLVRQARAAWEPNVRVTARKAGEDLLLIVVNEDEVAHMGVSVTGLETIEGKTLHLLYGDETRAVAQGEVVIRMQPLQVKVYCTDPARCVDDLTGRDFAD